MWDLKFEVEQLEGMSITLLCVKAGCEIIQQKATGEVIYDG